MSASPATTTSSNGAQGDDFVAASGNGNTLDGGAGNDQLVAGGAHAGDRFVFHPGYGMDSDHRLPAPRRRRHRRASTSTASGSNFTTLQPFMSDVGGNCVIALNGVDILTVNGALKAQFLATDFDNS